MINTQELLILFIAVVIASSLAVFALSSQLRSTVLESQTVASQVSNRISGDFDVVSVYASASDTNIVVRGRSGEVNMSSVTVFVDGSPVSVVYSGFVCDSDSDGMLDPGDMYLLQISGSYNDTHCIQVYAVDAYTPAPWGNCS